MLTIFALRFFARGHRTCRAYTQDLVSPGSEQVMHIMLTLLLTGCPPTPQEADRLTARIEAFRAALRRPILN